MNICPNCGRNLAEGALFCTECGTNLAKPNEPQQEPQQQIPQYQVPPVVNMQPPFQPMYGQPMITEAMLPTEFKPVSIGAYIGYSLLFSLPIIGFIMLLVIAFGSGQSKSLRNFAKAQLIMTAIGYVIAFFLVKMLFSGVFPAEIVEGFTYY